MTFGSRDTQTYMIILSLATLNNEDIVQLRTSLNLKGYTTFKI